MPVGDFVCFAVTDSGTGMTEATLQHATDPFFSTKPIGQGSGLGLSMAYGFAKQSGGHLSIESGPGTGTKVRLYMPRAVLGGEVSREETPTALPEHGLDLSGRRLLLVEDDSAVQRTARAQLKSLGAEVSVASTAEAALAALAAEGGFDAYLIDVVLPGTLSGPNLGAKINEAHAGAQILYMSGYARADLVAGARPDPESALLRKPFSKQDLARALQRVLEG
jgi:CheY-like chemotaxis protein